MGSDGDDHDAAVLRASAEISGGGRCEMERAFAMSNLTRELVLRFAEELAADSVPVDEILNSWYAATKRTYGCLQSLHDGQRCFVHSRLVEYQCFNVGCELNEARLTCDLHIMDPSHWDDHPSWIKEFLGIFHCGDSIAATPMKKLVDAKPVNEVARRSHQFKD